MKITCPDDHFTPLLTSPLTPRYTFMFPPLFFLSKKSLITEESEHTVALPQLDVEAISQRCSPEEKAHFFNPPASSTYRARMLRALCCQFTQANAHIPLSLSHTLSLSLCVSPLCLCSEEYPAIVSTERLIDKYKNYNDCVQQGGQRENIARLGPKSTREAVVLTAQSLADPDPNSRASN